MAVPTQADSLANALEALGRRRSRVSGQVALLVVIPSVLLVPVAYLVMREIQFALYGVNITWLSGAAAIALTVVPGVWLAQRMVKLVLRSRRAAWVGEVSRTHGVPVRSIEEFLEAD